MKIQDLINKHSQNWESENFDNWKITQIMYCKIGWCIDAIDGSEELTEQIEILINMQNFIEDLQKLEKLKK